MKYSSIVTILLSALLTSPTWGQDNLPPVRASLEREAKYYPIIDIPVPGGINLEIGSFHELADGRIAIGTRRGDIFLVSGLQDPAAEPKFQLFASGLHEVFGLAEKDGWIYATQQCEVTRIKDLDGDGRADRFETVSDAWGFGGEHEFTYGSKFDRDGYLWTVHCLTGSYTSDHLFRGWCLRISPDGKTIPTCSGLRSPGGIGMNSAGDMFYTENQGPWNGACSLKHLKPGGFMGHPISFKWYKNAPNMGPVPLMPEGGREHRQHIQAARIKQLVPPAVVFPYRKMGQSASAIVLDKSNGKFGPFAGQLFVADYTLSLVMRVSLEKVNGVYQGACYPFREGFKTGLIGATFTEKGDLLVGGCSRGWPARGPEPYALQRLTFSGKTPFEIKTMSLTTAGFRLEFTRPVDKALASQPSTYQLQTYTHYYQRGYGSPEVDHTSPQIKSAKVADNGRTVELAIDGLQIGHVHELSLPKLTDTTGETLLHPVAYYTLNQRKK